MRTSLDRATLARYVARQTNSMFPDGREVAEEMLAGLMPEIMSRIEHCFSEIANKYFFDGRTALFNHLHGDQYAMFLYVASRVAYSRGAGEQVASKLFLLNKALHGIDAYYEVELPAVFLFVHPLGTVLGRGQYADHLIVYQRCGVGSNHDQYPVLGPYTTLKPGAAVLGASRVGRNCTIAAESLVLDHDVPDDTVYIGNPRDHVIRAERALPPIWRRKGA